MAMMELVNMSQGVITELTKLAKPIKGLRNRKLLLESALKIQDRLPSSIREVVQEDRANLEEIASLHFASMPKSYLEDNLEDTDLVLDLLQGLFETHVESYQLSQDDIETVGGLLRILASVKIRSKNQLRKFIKCVEDKEDAYVVMKIHHKDGVEVRFRHDITENLKEYFDLKNQ